MKNSSKLSALYGLFDNLSILKGITSAPLTSAPVTSVNGQTGAVTLATGVSSVNGATGAVVQSGTPVQTVEVDLATSGTSAVVIPYDDTIPQITEGVEILTASITPKFSTSTLYVDVVVHGAMNTAGGAICAAVFRDSGANALGAAAKLLNANYLDQLTIRFKVASGSTTATTFRLRVGPGSTYTMTYNGSAGTRLLGGSAISSIKITEVLA
jgi:hypothetical protein